MARNIPENFILVFMLMILGFILSFTSVNVSSELANVFYIMLGISLIYSVFDKKHTLPLGQLTLKSVGYALLGYVIVIGVSALIKSTGVFGIDSTLSIWEIVKESQSSFVFADNPTLTFFFFGFVVAIIETVSLAILWELFRDFGEATRLYKLDLQKFIGIFLLFSTLFSISFMFLHLTAKGIENNSALMTVLVFGFVTYWLFFKTKDQMAAILLHIIANTTALSLSFFETVPGARTFLLVGGIIFGLYLLLRRVNISPNGGLSLGR